MEKKQYIINDVGELARVGGISHSTLLRLFREHHNCTPHAFLRSKQLELGAALLKCSSVKEAAQQCGFDDAAHFSRSFKEQFGISPSKYKKQI